MIGLSSLCLPGGVSQCQPLTIVIITVVLCPVIEQSSQSVPPSLLGLFIQDVRQVYELNFLVVSKEYISFIRSLVVADMVEWSRGWHWGVSPAHCPPSDLNVAKDL